MHSHHRRIEDPDAQADHAIQAGTTYDVKPIYARGRAANKAYRISRNQFSVSVTINKRTHSDLFLSGRMGLATNGEEWWDFSDEVDLRSKLRMAFELIPTVVAGFLDILADHT